LPNKEARNCFLFLLPSPTLGKNKLKKDNIFKMKKKESREHKQKKTNKLLEVGLVVEEVAKRSSTPTQKKMGRNTNLKRNKKKLKKTMRTHNKEAMKSTKKGFKEVPKKKTPKNFTSTQQGGNKAHYKHTTMKQCIVRK
jgi:hypothetical protein